MAWRSSAIVLLLAVLSSLDATAANGVREINEACAQNTGCLAGDVAGFPVTIGTPGSYVLTGNLTVTDADTTAIEITAADVSLDLNGFVISGPTTCSGVPTSCTDKGSGNGVSVDASTHTGVTVMNGSIRGMGRDGISLGRSARVERLHVESNGQHGITAGIGSVVVANTSTTNEDNGIQTGASCVVRDNTAQFNGAAGIAAFFASVIGHNTVKGNAAAGITTTGSSTIRGNTVDDNGVGISAAAGSLVIGNTARANTGLALTASSSALVFGYRDNVFTDNNGGDANPQVSEGGATEIGTNLCGNDTVCL